MRLCLRLGEDRYPLPPLERPRYLRGAYIMNHKKLLLTLTLCLCALLCMVVTASASEVQGHSHLICKGTTCTDPAHASHNDVTFEKAITMNDNGVLCIGGTEAQKYDGQNYDYILQEGTYYLDGDLTLHGGIQVKGSVTLCLNGHAISNDYSHVIQTPWGGDATFTLCDCKGEGKIAHVENSESTGTGVNLNNTSTSQQTFIMYNGCITQNRGSGVCLYQNTSFTMYGGSITGNTLTDAPTFGGGVYVHSGASFTMYGGEITKNQADYGGGVSTSGNTANFTMYGGSITKNHANKSGGGIYSTSNNISIYGGGVTNNSVTKTGNAGGIYVSDSGTLTVGGNVNISGNWKGEKNGSISNNNANNVYLPANSTITIEKALTGSSIGVTTATEPGTGSNVTFANSSTNTITTGIFTPDTAGVLVGVAADGKSAYLYKCDHSKNTNKTWEAGSSNHWQVCSICGCKANEASHNMVEKDAKAPTCTSAGWDAYNACEVCGYKSGYKEIAALDHDMKNHDAQSPTCTETGHTAYRKCDRSGCNYKEGYELIPKLNHAFAAAWDHNDDKHWHKCTRDGCTGIDAEASHNWRDATTSAPKTCTVCGATTGTKLSSYYYYSPAKTEDTPVSPKAGDPGVLLYAGLALASLAGLTYTAKKRH